MGHLIYGNSKDAIAIPDRLLPHVKVVVATKLRRLESFTISWQHPADAPRGRSTIWMHPSIPLRFVFDAAEATQLDRAYLQKLAQAAGSTGGMVIDLTALAEPSDAPPVAAAPGSDLVPAA